MQNLGGQTRCTVEEVQMANTGSWIQHSRIFYRKIWRPALFHSFLESRFLFKRLINEKANQI